MRWVRITNAGDFDVASAVNMIGASVKECDSPIGLFGSGTKYALAQAARQGITVKIASAGVTLTSMTEKQEFRNTEFDVVTFRSNTGKKIKTPITTKFGAEDWKQTWFIFREFFSNAIDEGSRQVEIVDGVEPIDGHTCVFLPYNQFKDVCDNIGHYFTTTKTNTMWVGDGSVYRRGVLIGQLKGTKVSFHVDNVKINECRIMDEMSAKNALYESIYALKSVEVVSEFFKSDKEFLSSKSWYLDDTGTHYEDVIIPALVAAFGEKYCICPDVNDIVRDVQAMGFNPVVMPTVYFNESKCRTYKSLDNGHSIRSMNSNEYVQFDKAWKRIEMFIPESFHNTKFLVISEAAGRLLGQADVKQGIVYLRDSLFNEGFDKELTHTLLHEMGHIVTKAGDYDRAFTKWFIDCLISIAM